VITFLVITSIINLALGYALAVYLGSESASAAATEPMAQDASLQAFAAAGAFAMDGKDLSWPTSSMQAMPSVTPPARVAETTVNSTAAGFKGMEPVESEPQARTAEMEQELLAGIEEFRNQLAQLKGQGFDGGVGNPFAPEAVGAG
jgi:hypothetical protein